MKKSIFLFFAAILCAIGAKAYNQSAVDLYFDNSTAKWTNCYVYIGHSTWTSVYPLTRVSGTQYLWKLAKADFNGGKTWEGASGWVVCKEKWWDSNGETIDKFVHHGAKNVTEKKTSAWSASYIYKADGTKSVTSDSKTETVYKLASSTKSNYAVIIKTVTGGTLTVKDYDNATVSNGASKIKLTVLKFSAAPASGYVFDGVQINNGSTTTTISAANISSETYTLTSAVTITPVWKATTSTVTVTTSATNGTVTGGGVVEEGSSVTLTATPNAGYQFKNWTVAGAEVSTANPYTFTAEEDVTVVANFEELPKATIYFVNNAGWSKVQAYAWDGSKGANPGWPGADITANKLAEKIGEYDVYSYTVEQGSYGKVIFNNGSAQTADYVWTDGNYYWHNEAVNFAGGTKAQAEEKFGTKTYTVVGSSAPLFGEAWATAKTENDMTLVEGTKYELVKTDVSLTVGEIQYKVAVNHAWDEAYPGENAILNISEAGKYTVTFTFDSNTKAVNATAELEEAAVVLPTVGVKGAWDGWATTTTLTGDNTSAAATVNIATAGVYEFGLDVDGNFQASGATIDKANNSTVVTTNAGNMKLTANVLGEYTFTWTYETKTLVVTYPAGEEVEIAKKYYIAGTQNLTGFDWKENGLEMTKVDDVYKHTFSELGAGIYEFKITDGTWTNPWGYSNLGAAYEEVSEGTDGEGNPNGNIKFVTEEAKNITVIFDPAAGKITIAGLTEKAPVVSTYALMGVGGDWTTGITMTVNPYNADEYVLKAQSISSTDAIKVLETAGSTQTWHSTVDAYSNATYTLDDDGFGGKNIVLTTGTYNFYFKKINNEIYIEEVYVRDVTNTYGTICLPYASNSYDGAIFYRVAGKETGKVYLESVSELEAGVPYIFEKTANKIVVARNGDPVANAGSANGLVGTFTDETPVAAGNYILYNNQLRPSNGTAKVNANRAYLDMNAVKGGAPQQMPGRRYIGMAVQGENEATGFENITAPEGETKKVLINGQLIIIRGGEKFNAQGVRF